MAKPIKITPVLKGKDAIKFLNTINLNKDKKVDKEQLAAIQANANALRALLKN
jgi:hypothetical protein